MAIIGTLPNNLQNGTTADASQVMADFNFIVNQVNANAAALSNLITGGQLINIRVFTSSGTYTATSGTTRIIVELIGGGGAGGGAIATAGGQVSVGAGGGAGAYVRTYIVAPAPTAFTIGAGGTGIAGGGGNFGTSSFFGSLTAGGGGGGFGSSAAASTTAAPGAGGGGSGGNLLNISGQPGFPGWADTTKGITGAGGNTFLGAGGAGAPFTNSPGNNAGTGFGGGGSGALNSPSQASALAGGNGGNGVLIIYEYV